MIFIKSEMFTNIENLIFSPLWDEVNCVSKNMEIVEKLSVTTLETHEQFSSFERKQVLTKR